MKKNLLILTALILCTVFISTSCKKNSSSQPCDGKGTVCFENKRDSLLIINIVQSHSTINLQHDEMQCQIFSGGTTYTIKYSGPAYTGNLKDTTMLVQNCDNKLIIINPPKK
ncbi:MAG: hypothetical protein NTY96_06625 [Bacteroidetes bacterium]|nr:hypothetical protein [Bacteroidota bacterium]